ncbi:alpha/beta hydrolase [Planococcus salinus]|uniref:Alpha/beta hydrolase n=1 Tax=Planococcus salinus TaxID=1848460 RepID=A0A3M8P4S4_9BACL|nr:alpha/beta hydrolase [Planococcus salinus]RNF38214.1 alpha/beta hydrolase [Planococcus salinus]
MTNKKQICKYTKWAVPFFLIAILIAVTLFEPTASPHNASASKQTVNVIKDLAYSKEDKGFLDIYYPAEVNESMPVILWIHGGGYIGGSKESRQHYAMTLAADGYVVANMDYALAPMHQYPTPIFQANEALEYLKLHAPQYGGDMNRIFIGGDSAGAQLSSQLAAVLTNEKLAAAMEIQPAVEESQLRGAILFCGLYNMDTVRATGFPNIELFLTAYTGAEPFESFSDIDELSTVSHITPDYPPVFITVGDADPFASQSVELVQVLNTHQVPVDSVFFDGTYKNLAHEYQYVLDTIDAQQTLEKTLEFLSLNGM